MTDARWPTSKAAKQAGWFSRRHETREAMDAAREKYQWNRGRAARQRRAQERLSGGSWKTSFFKLPLQ